MRRRPRWSRPSGDCSACSTTRAARPCCCHWTPGNGACGTTPRSIFWLNGYLGELTGAPDQEPWGWQLAGHHLALNCVIVDGQMVISPAFLGAEPNWAPGGPYGDAVLFADEERMGAELMASLSPGLRRQRLMALAGEFLVLPAGPRAQRLAEIERYIDDTHFCWIGETDGEHP
ncbi:MAG TPA: DUF3500 domain-containing protein, partial [Trebonia sp.]|nr:DUF3500 domain-containing protein [Trebonia sp.]